jgi:hypothetical protein
VNAYRPSEVDVHIDQRGQAGRVGVALGAELAEGRVGVAGVPEHDGVEHKAERAELVLLALPVGLAESWE